ncbi:MAG: alcohol dehydrogenase catalytic domain-containing protein [Candidatus Sumerlaeia bacterium]|nr:alcohol dehydrogenase catalytic domain-containing protein [Candidatus Sumerlaeia bacterium]
MKVVHLTTPETVELFDLPARRETGAGELLVEPLVVGISGTDALHYRRGAPLTDGFRHPHIPGTECVARVVGVDRGVHKKLLWQRVVLDPVSPCMKCEWCRDGQKTLCPHARTLGCPPVMGAMQQRFSWPSALCVPIPDDMPDELAVLATPLSLAAHFLEVARFPFMGSAAVVGCGHLGLLTIKVLRARGAGEIIAIDPIGYRRRAAVSMGADKAFDPIEAIDYARSSKSGGVHLAIDVSNASESSRTAVAVSRRGGQVLIGGIPLDNRVLFDAREARQKALTVNFTRRPHNTLARSLRLRQSPQMEGVEATITHLLSLEEVPDAFRMIRRMEEDVIKVVIQMPTYEPREESAQMITGRVSANGASEPIGQVAKG